MTEEMNFRMKKGIPGVLLCLIIILCAVYSLAETVYDSGEEGNISWKITETTEEYYGYALTISGNGDMRDYDPPNDCCPGTVHAPWILDYVGKGSMYGRNFNQIFIDEGITRIGRNAFCINRGQYMTTIGEIEIPSTVKSIGTGAFMETCLSFGPTRLKIPDTVETIEPNAIKANILIVCSSNSEAYRYAKENGNRVELNDVSVELEQEKYTLNAGERTALKMKVTPSTVSPVFSSSNESVAVVNPDTWQIIALQEGNTRIAIRVESEYRYCQVHVQPESISAKEILKLPRFLTEIGDEAFAGIASKKIVISDKTVTIGARAFADCPNLRFLVIPDSVQSISDDALDGCSDVILVCSYSSDAPTWAQEHGCYVVYGLER